MILMDAWHNAEDEDTRGQETVDTIEAGQVQSLRRATVNENCGKFQHLSRREPIRFEAQRRYIHIE